MPNYRNIETGPLDIEDWEITFEPYGEDSGAALTLGFNLMVLKAYLALEPVQIDEAIAGLDRALEAIYPYTQFHRVSYRLVRNLVEGKMSVEHEDALKKLGIKF
jgi:hypothetical protein